MGPLTLACLHVIESKIYLLNQTAAALGSVEVKPLPSLRGSKTYRRRIVAKLARFALPP